MKDWAFFFVLFKMFKIKESKKKSKFFDEYDEDGGSKRNLTSWNLKLVGGLAIFWSLFQLWYASPLPYLLDFGKFIDVPARAIHLAFGMSCVFWHIHLLNQIETKKYL